MSFISFEFQCHFSIFCCMPLGLELQSHVPALSGFLLVSTVREFAGLEEGGRYSACVVCSSITIATLLYFGNSS